MVKSLYLSVYFLFGKKTVEYNLTLSLLSSEL